MSFEFKVLKKVKLNKPILIEGLPGIGNVGKITADFIIESLKAEKIIDIRTYNLPNAVFVGEDNLIELPSLAIYYKRWKNNDILILGGDVQPLDEKSCYEFCDLLLQLLKSYNTQEIITIGGIGLGTAPMDPKVFATANNKKMLAKYKHNKVSSSLYGIVGPIVGVTGILPALSSRYDIPSIILLAETLGHPGYLGIKGSRAVLQVLESKFSFKMDLKSLDAEINELETELKAKDLSLILKKQSSIDYIG
ncbi:MAG: PAC2 family protein [Candidatus Nanoarchaeia archaeon]|nr:PAC2 family protein [Candidatus Nanoarchaeia archaeon]